MRVLLPHLSPTLLFLEHLPCTSTYRSRSHSKTKGHLIQEARVRRGGGGESVMICVWDCTDGDFSVTSTEQMAEPRASSLPKTPPRPSCLGEPLSTDLPHILCGNLNRSRWLGAESPSGLVLRGSWLPLPLSPAFQETVGFHISQNDPEKRMLGTRYSPAKTAVCLWAGSKGLWPFPSTTLSSEMGNRLESRSS